MVQIKQKRGTGVESQSPNSFSGGLYLAEMIQVSKTLKSTEMRDTHRHGHMSATDDQCGSRR